MLSASETLALAFDPLDLVPGERADISWISMRSRDGQGLGLIFLQGKLLRLQKRQQLAPEVLADTSYSLLRGEPPSGFHNCLLRMLKAGFNVVQPRAGYR